MIPLRAGYEAFAIGFLSLLCLAIVLPHEVRAADTPRSHDPARVAAAYHYEPIPGKLVFIDPDVWTLDRLTEVRLQWGFSALLLLNPPLQYQTAIDAGYTPASIAVNLDTGDYASMIDGYEGAFYYIDEPVEHNCSGQSTLGRFYPPDQLTARHNYVLSHRPGARFIIDGYKRCSHNIIAAASADVMMYSSYVNWSEFGIPFCHVHMGWGNDYESPWTTGSSDQRDSWTDMRQVFGQKFSMSWIHGGGDEYDLLLGHATNLGLEAVWVYCGTSFNPATIDAFCAAAVAHGWLRRVEGPPLPVQLASFQASATSGHSATLQWTTLSEINSYGFVIQRHAEGVDRFTDLPGGFVNGQGTTAVPHDYVYVDTTASPGRWWYRLKLVDLDGSFTMSDPVIAEILTAVGNDPVTASFFLSQNYPNPFNPTTAISYQLPIGSDVRLTVCDLLGREVAVLVDEKKPAGSYTTTFDGSNLGSGVYFCRLQTADFVATRTLVLVK